MTDYEKTLLCMRDLFYKDKVAYRIAYMTIIFQNGQDPDETLEDEYVYALFKRSIKNEVWVADNRFTWHDVADAMCYLRGEYSINELRFLASDMCSDKLFGDIVVGACEACRLRSDELTSKDVVLGKALKSLDNNISKLRSLNKPRLTSIDTPKIVPFPNKDNE